MSGLLEKLRSVLGIGGELAKVNELAHTVTIEHHYHVECRDKDGNLKWEEEFTNLVVTTGLNKYLDATLKTGLASPSWFVGLITGPGAGNTYVIADTMTSHAGWAESSAYSNATRPAFTPGAIAAGSVDNSAAKASFTINATATIAGSFMADNSTKGGSTGTLLGEGNFTGGDRAVVNGDTLNVTITATIA
jgi:hypothetical protein